jgi:DNA-binding NtrC family response regulator
MKTILVAEDNRLLRATYVRALERDFKVLQAHNKNTAIGILAHDFDHEIAAVVSDYDLGDGTGAEILWWVRGKRPDLPFYLCTGNTGVSLGVPTFYKPFDMGELLKALSAAL